MSRQLAALVAAGTTALATIGCSTGNYRSGDLATTNTSTLSSGERPSHYAAAKIDWMKAGHDTYAIQPRTPGTAVTIDHPTVGEVALPRSLVLDARGIPHSNSTTDRRENDVTVTANDQLSYLVNVAYNAAGELIIPTTGEPRNTFWHLHSDSLPSRTVEDPTGTFESEIFDRIMDQDPYVTAEGKSLVPFPIRDPLGRRARLYMVSDSMAERDKTVRANGVETVTRGFEAVAYIWMPGVENPLDPADPNSLEGEGLPVIIGGEPAD